MFKLSSQVHFTTQDPALQRGKDFIKGKRKARFPGWIILRVLKLETGSLLSRFLSLLPTFLPAYLAVICCTMDTALDEIYVAGATLASMLHSASLKGQSDFDGLLFGK